MDINLHLRQILMASSLTLSALSANASDKLFFTQNGCALVEDVTETNAVSVTWSGRCDHGGADGLGTAVWTIENNGKPEIHTITGTFVDGKAQSITSSKIAKVPELRSKHYTNAEYQGDLKNGLPSGHGVMSFANGARYEGDFENGVQNGHGVMLYANGDKYDGDFSHGVRNGHGAMSYVNGEKYDGDFVNGELGGHGVMLYSNGDKYEGDYANGERDGTGTYHYHGGGYYEGQYVNGKKNGHGVEYGVGFLGFIGRPKLEGEWVDGKFQGSDQSDKDSDESGPPSAVGQILGAVIQAAPIIAEQRNAQLAQQRAAALAAAQQRQQAELAAEQRQLVNQQQQLTMQQQQAARASAAYQPAATQSKPQPRIPTSSKPSLSNNQSVSQAPNSTQSATVSSTHPSPVTTTTVNGGVSSNSGNNTAPTTSAGVPANDCITEVDSGNGDGSARLLNKCTYAVNLLYTFSQSKPFTGGYITLRPTETTFETAQSTEFVQFYACKAMGVPQSLNGGCL